MFSVISVLASRLPGTPTVCFAGMLGGPSMSIWEQRAPMTAFEFVQALNEPGDAQSTEGQIETKGTYVHTHYCGIGIRSEPAYPGERTGHDIQRHQAVRIAETTMVEYQHTDGKTYDIKFFKLADGRGWIHDFSPALAKQGNGDRTCSLCVSTSQIEANAEVEAKRQAEAHAAQGAGNPFSKFQVGRMVVVKTPEEMKAIFEDPKSQWNMELADRLNNNTTARFDKAGLTGRVDECDSSDNTIKVSFNGNAGIWFTPEMLSLEEVPPAAKPSGSSLDVIRGLFSRLNMDEGGGASALLDAMTVTEQPAEPPLDHGIHVCVLDGGVERFVHEFNQDNRLVDLYSGDNWDFFAYGNLEELQKFQEHIGLFLN